MTTKTSLLLGIGLSFLLAAPSSRACDIATNIGHQLDPGEQAQDRTAPMPGNIRSARFEYSDACDIDSNVLTVDITSGTDDRTQQGELGYVLEVASGSLPPGFTLSSDPARPYFDARPLLYFGKTKATSVDLELRLITVDRAGNRSGPSVPIRVERQIEPALGCSAAPGTRHTAGHAGILCVSLGLAALIMLRRRRPLRTEVPA